MRSELLDRADAPPVLVRASLADLRRANALLGARRAVLEALAPILRAAPRETSWTLLDLGTGAGDIPAAAVRLAARWDRRLTAVGLDFHRAAAALARDAGIRAVVADLEHPPIAPQSVDIVVLSQLLHHAPRGHAVRWIRLAVRLARRAVIVADLRRSFLAVLGLWLASFPLAFHPVSRRDGMISVRRGFTLRELEDLVRAGGIEARVRSRPGFRLVAVWERGG